MHEGKYECKGSNLLDPLHSYFPSCIFLSSQKGIVQNLYHSQAHTRSYFSRSALTFFVSHIFNM